jgi:hypothetical protein
MLVSLGLSLGVILIAAAIHSELRSAYYGIALSNGVEVLVSPAMYREIVRQYRMRDDRDTADGWDQTVLEVLRSERPQESRLLARSLGHSIVPGRHGARRRRSQSVPR